MTGHLPGDLPTLNCVFRAKRFCENRSFPCINANLLRECKVAKRGTATVVVLQPSRISGNAHFDVNKSYVYEVQSHPVDGRKERGIL